MENREEVVRVSEMFSSEIDPDVEIFVKHLVLYSLHENEYIELDLLDIFDISERIKTVGDAVRIFGYNFRSVITKVINLAYPSEDRLSADSHLNFLHRYLPWFYHECTFIFRAANFLVMTALAVEVIYTLWDSSESLYKNYIQLTLHTLSSVFSSQEFKRYTSLDLVQDFAKYAVECHKRAFELAKQRPRNVLKYRIGVDLDYFEEILESSDTSPEEPEEIQDWLERYARGFSHQLYNLRERFGEYQFNINLEGRTGRDEFFRKMTDVFRMMKGKFPPFHDVCHRVRQTTVKLPAALTGMQIIRGRPERPVSLPGLRLNFERPEPPVPVTGMHSNCKTHDFPEVQQEIHLNCETPKFLNPIIGMGSPIDRPEASNLVTDSNLVVENFDRPELLEAEKGIHLIRRIEIPRPLTRIRSYLRLFNV